MLGLQELFKNGLGLRLQKAASSELGTHLARMKAASGKVCVHNRKRLLVPVPDVNAAVQRHDMRCYRALRTCVRIGLTIRSSRDRFAARLKW